MSRALFIATDPHRVIESVEKDYKAIIEERLRENQTIKSSESCRVKRHLRRSTLNNGIEVIRNCRNWKCEACAVQMTLILIKRTSLALIRHNLTRLATLTLDPKKIPEGEAPPEYLMKCWSRFSRALRRKKPGLSWLWVLDVGKNDRHFHLHVLFSKYVDWRPLKKMWGRAGGGKVTDIRTHDFAPLYLFKSFGTQRDPGFVAQANNWQAKRRYDFSESLAAIMRGEEE